MISEPKVADEAQEKKLRTLIEGQANYAESGPTFDPKGEYLCGACSLREGTNQCWRVIGPISFTAGSCSLWTTETKPSRRVPKISQGEARYAERPKAKGFGCFPRCEYGSRAKEADSEGRKIWCGFWGLHVMAAACCSEEDGDDLTLAPGESKSQSEDT